MISIVYSKYHFLKWTLNLTLIFLIYARLELQKSSNFNNSYDLSGAMCRKGVCSNNEHRKINLQTINSVLTITKINPRLTGTELRPLLYESIPIGTELSS